MLQGMPPSSALQAMPPGVGGAFPMPQGLRPPPTARPTYPGQAAAQVAANAQARAPLPAINSQQIQQILATGKCLRSGSAVMARKAGLSLCPI